MLRRWLIVIAIPCVFQLAFLLILFQSQRERADAQRWAIHTVEVIAQAEAISGMMSEARSDLFSRALTNSKDRGRVEEIAAEIMGQFDSIHNMVNDNPKSQAIIDDVTSMSRRFIANLKKVDESVRSGDDSPLIERLKNTSSHDTLREIREHFGMFLSSERKLDRLRRHALEEIVRLQTQVLMYGSALTIAIVLALIAVFSRGFVRRVTVLANNARNLAEGKALSSPLSGDDEIAQLDGVFHAMAKTLAERDRENEMFIYSVSHDLRSPLVNLQGFSRELLLSTEDLKALISSAELADPLKNKISRITEQDMKGAIHFIQNAVDSPLRDH